MTLATVPETVVPGRRAPRRRQQSLRSALLGEILVPDGAVLEFPEGLFGFPNCHEWALVDSGRPGWWWLHAMDQATLAFLLVDPFECFPDFSVGLSPHDLEVLGVQHAHEVAVFAIVTLPRAAGDAITANLQGPVAIALPSRRGRQLVSGDARPGGSRTPLPEAGTQVLRRRDDTDS